MFGVRGLGTEQIEARAFTEAKVVSLLSVSPFTYQQLWKLARVHRNTLRVRLDCMVDRGIILKHRYSVPRTVAFYGPAYKYPIPYWTPLYNHIYYLLNYCNPKTNRLLRSYLVRTEVRGKKENTDNRNGVETLPFFSFLENICKGKINEIEKSTPWVKKFPSRRICNTIFEIFLWKDRCLRECDLASVKNRVYLRDRPIGDKDLRNLRLAVEFFSNKGYDVNDILIRCAIEITYLEGSLRVINPWSTALLDLPMMRYSRLWKMMNKLGYNVQTSIR